MIQDKSLRKTEDTFNLQLIITEQCNLHCRYCFEINKSSRFMPLELAKRLLANELGQENGPKKYQIDLVGGEPLLHFDLIKEIVEYGKLNVKLWAKKFWFVIGTNLMLLNPERERWLEENKHCVILSTSLDGTREAHNHYRCCSYDAVANNLPFYRRLYPFQGVKMTIGPDTIGSVYEGIRNIESMGLLVAANVVYEPVWGDLENKKACLEKFSRQLQILIRYYESKPNARLPNLLSLPIHKLPFHGEEENHWCGSGINMKAYDTDGRELPCHRFSFFSSKKIYEGSDSFGPRVSTKCDYCIYAAACPTCRGYNWQLYNNPNSRSSYHCEFIKLQLLATAKLEYLRNVDLVKGLASGNLPPDVPPGVLRTLQGAIFVLNGMDEGRIISECEVGWP